MRTTVENICSEFSDFYNVSESESPEQITAEIEITIEDLGDLCSIFEDYGVGLSEIKQSESADNCVAVFVQRPCNVYCFSEAINFQAPLYMIPGKSLLF